MTDFIQHSYHWFLQLFDTHLQGFSYAVIRLTLLLGIPTLLLKVAFAQGNNSRLLAGVIAAIGFAIGIELSLGWIENLNISLRAWGTLGSLLALRNLPHALSFYLVPELGAQRKLSFILFAITVTLIILAMVFQ